MIAATIQCLWAMGMLLVAETRAIAKLRVVSKCVASLAFVVVGIVAYDGSDYARWIVIGLVLGAVGDVCLLGAGKRAFLSGLVAFLLGHLAYVVAIAQIRPIDQWATLLAIVPAIAGATALVWLRPHTGRLTIPVIAYVAVITTMVIGALATDRTTLRLGAVLFFASDLAVARHRFVERALSNKLWGLPAYYVGQLLIAWSIGS